MTKDISFFPEKEEEDEEGFLLFRRTRSPLYDLSSLARIVWTLYT